MYKLLLVSTLSHSHVLVIVRSIAISHFIDNSRHFLNLFSLSISHSSPSFSPTTILIRLAKTEYTAMMKLAKILAILAPYHFHNICRRIISNFVQNMVYQKHRIFIPIYDYIVLWNTLRKVFFQLIRINVPCHHISPPFSVGWSPQSSLCPQSSQNCSSVVTLTI